MPSRRNPAAAAALLLILAALLSLLTPGPAAAGTGDKGGAVWGAGYFPDAELTTHEGKKVRFFTDLIKGKVVVINFIYTSCPDVCALETARLSEVQRILGERVGHDVFIYSITIDPVHDTPKVLKEFADKFRIGPGWLFLTGKDADITKLRVKLGLYSETDRAGKLEDHNVNLIIGNQATGQWMKSSPYENPYVLATQVGSWLHNWKAPAKEQSYAQAPKLRDLATGESLFRTRCSACHTVGEGKDREIGPDLMGVTTKRDRAWLVRWLAETDKVLAEKDPIAMELLARYNQLPMPNLRLSGVDIQAVLTYLEEESRRVEHLRHHQHGGQGHGDHEHMGHEHGGGHTDHEHGGHDHMEHDHMEHDHMEHDHMEHHSPQ